MRYYSLDKPYRKSEIMTAAGNWLNSYNWDYFATFTSKKMISDAYMEKRFIKFMENVDVKAMYFYVIEPFRSLDFSHIHALIGNTLHNSAEIAYKWQKDYGIAKIHCYIKYAKGNYYICKRLANPSTLWGFKLI